MTGKIHHTFVHSSSISTKPILSLFPNVSCSYLYFFIHIHALKHNNEPQIWGFTKCHYSSTPFFSNASSISTKTILSQFPPLQDSFSLLLYPNPCTTNRERTTNAAFTLKNVGGQKASGLLPSFQRSRVWEKKEKWSERAQAHSQQPPATAASQPASTPAT